MQYPFSCVPDTLNAIERTLSPARLARYVSAAKGDRHLALRLYVWNARLCEAVYLPLQIAEVAVRNAINIPVERRFKAHWYSNPKFTNILSLRMKQELAEIVRKQESKRGSTLNQNHIIANLSFGFWVNLMANSFDNHLWATGIKTSFPYAQKHEDRQSVYLMLDEIRIFRNEIMHHCAIFDKSPQRRYQSIIHITKMICNETYWLSKELSHFGQVLNDRPLT
jgi:hypothetical protein